MFRIKTFWEELDQGPEFFSVNVYASSFIRLFVMRTYFL